MMTIDENKVFHVIDRVTEKRERSNFLTEERRSKRYWRSRR
jgi:hypothetical protein